VGARGRTVLAGGGACAPWRSAGCCAPDLACGATACRRRHARAPVPDHAAAAGCGKPGRRRAGPARCARSPAQDCGGRGRGWAVPADCAGNERHRGPRARSVSLRRAGPGRDASRCGAICRRTCAGRAACAELLTPCAARAAGEGAGGCDQEARRCSRGRALLRQHPPGLPGACAQPADGARAPAPASLPPVQAGSGRALPARRGWPARVSAPRAARSRLRAGGRLTRACAAPRRRWWA